LFLLLALILVCSGAAHADTFASGQYLTYDQAEWGDVPNGTNAASLLQNNYNAIYASSSGVFTIGLPYPAYFVDFTGYDTLLAYLPDVGPVGIFDSSLLDPTTTSAGAFGGVVTALKLNIDFSNAGLMVPGGSFGSLYLTGFGGSDSGLNGLTLSQLLALDNTELGGGTTGFSTLDLATVTAEAEAAFDEGNPSAYADEHLTTTNPNGGGSSTPTPEPSSLLLLAPGLLALGMLRYWRRHGSAIPS
jgi:hypothetical protein